MDINPTWAWIALALQTPAYFAIYLYLDNVIPNSFGISKDCCYCFRRRQRNNQPAIRLPSSKLNDSAKQFEINDGEKDFDLNDPIRISGLTKKFGSNFIAVDNLTLSIKNNEVLSILGHNGAGKTTAIYMLTGML